MKAGMAVVLCGTLVLVAGVLEVTGRPPAGVPVVGDAADQELAQLLVKLELRTRGVIAKHYASADTAHRDWLAKDLLLPAAVADAVFHETVQQATGQRAWVKMVVDEPRNPHNRAVATAPSRGRVSIGFWIGIRCLVRWRSTLCIVT